MRVLVATDSFKESCSASEACESIRSALSTLRPTWQIETCPLGDGGEGTIAAIQASLAMQIERVSVMGPLREPVEAEIAWLETPLPPCLSTWYAPQSCERLRRVALIEAASCIGLVLVPRARRDPTRTTSFGLGQLLLHARRSGAALTILGLGGTATVDAGIGMAQALGVEFPGISPCAGGAELARVTRLEMPHSLGTAAEPWQVIIASDVHNPLLGERGAARVFGPQKGATPKMVQSLELGIENYARRVVEANQRALAEPCDSVAFARASAEPGTGAAGGIGFSIRQLLGGEFVRGVELVMRCVDFERRLRGADAVITGEGRLDASSFEGKVVSGVLAACHRRGIAVHVLCGDTHLGRDEYRARGISEVEALVTNARDHEDSKNRVRELLGVAAQRLAERLA